MRSNILVLVGGGPVPRYPPNKVVVWDDYQAKMIVELDFPSEVRGVKVRQERLLVVLDTSLYVYSFKDLSFLTQFSTAANPTGLAAMNATSPLLELFPAAAQGCLLLRTETIDESGASAASERTIGAHNGPLACIATTLDGKLVATASEKGTLIRVWDTETGAMVKELRRGAENARVWCMCFSHDGTMLAVSSSRGTCHIFGIAELANKRSSLGALRTVLPAYFKSEWSSMQAVIPAVPSVIAFAPDKASLFVVAHDGTYQRILIDGSTTPPVARVDPTKGNFNFMR